MGQSRDVQNAQQTEQSSTSFVPRCMMPLQLLAWALIAPTDPTPQVLHRQALDKLARANFVSFTVNASQSNVALPEPGVQHPFVKGKILLAKDGRWYWEREDCWAFLFDGKLTWKTAKGSGWFEEAGATSLSGSRVDTASLRAHLIGMEIFLDGKWKGVRGQEDWVGAGLLEDWDSRGPALIVGRPKSRVQIRATREGDLAAGYYLYFDKATLLPMAGETYSSSSYDREEVHVDYSDVRYDPPGAEQILVRKN